MRKFQCVVNNESTPAPLKYPGIFFEILDNDDAIIGYALTFKGYDEKSGERIDGMYIVDTEILPLYIEDKDIASKWYILGTYGIKEYKIMLDVDRLIPSDINSNEIFNQIIFNFDMDKEDWLLKSKKDLHIIPHPLCVPFTKKDWVSLDASLWEVENEDDIILRRIETYAKLSKQ